MNDISPLYLSICTLLFFVTLHLYNSYAVKFLDLNSCYQPTAVVIANGTFPNNEKVRGLLAEAPHLLVCDGALKSYLQHSDRTPDAVIGDGDSVAREDLQQVRLPLTLVTDQESNDLTKAVDYAHSKGWNNLLIIGATGQREDHTIGNVFLLAEYYKKGVQARIYSTYGWFIPFQGALTLQAELGQGLSLFSTEPKPMSATGVAYPFEDRIFTAPWQATLNYITAPTVQLYSGGIALLYISHEKRQVTL